MPDFADRFYWKMLVVRCQVGDTHAIEELVTECHPRLRSFIHKMLPGYAGVDDLTQEVWMDVFRNLPKLAEPGSFVPWVYQIARARVFRMLRRRDRTVPLGEVDVADDHQHDPEFTPEDAVRVHAALDQLPPEHREVLLLRFIEDMSYEDIAAVAECPLGTVRSRLHNAKRLLRQVLERGEQP